MTLKIDAFAHVLLPKFFDKMQALDKDLVKKMPFIQNPVLTDMAKRRETMPDQTRQIISYVNANPEDYVDGKEAAKLVQLANEELLATVQEHSDLSAGGCGDGGHESHCGFGTRGGRTYPCSQGTRRHSAFYTPSWENRSG